VAGDAAAAARRKQEAAAQTLTMPLVGAAGQLPKLDLFYLFRRYLTTHGGGLQIDPKVVMCSVVPCNKSLTVSGDHLPNRNVYVHLPVSPVKVRQSAVRQRKQMCTHMWQPCLPPLPSQSSPSDQMNLQGTQLLTQVATAVHAQIRNMSSR
jgi:hypothetical protein